MERKQLETIELIRKAVFHQKITTINGYDGFAVVSSGHTLVRQHCPTEDVGVGEGFSMKPCNKIYNGT